MCFGNRERGGAIFFRVFLGRGIFHYTNFKSWEGAQTYLSGKGSLFVWKGVVKLPSPRIGSTINKCPE